VFRGPFVTEEMEYLSADVEDRFVIAQANTPWMNNEFVRRDLLRYHSSFIISNARQHRLYGRGSPPDRGYQRRPDPLPGAR
jgi:DNA-directed RNA polymerase beta subunit